MMTMSLEMRSIAEASRSSIYKQEEADFKERLASWQKRHKENAKRALAVLPDCIRAAAEKGNRRFLLRVEIDPPYTFGDAYQEFEIDHDFGDTESGIQLSLATCKVLPVASRPIARWTLRQGFQVWTSKWDYKDDRSMLFNKGYYEVETFRTSVIGAPDVEGVYTLHEGLIIGW